MAFDIEQWKAQIYIRYQKLQDGLNRESANQLYAFLSVTALWPVLDAAQRGDWGAVGTLASLTAVNLGTNLLANQIQSWKDESSAIKEINETIQNDPAVRAELDLVLQKLDAISIAEQNLSASDRAWFSETFQRELKSIKSSITYSSTVTGNGASAQGNGAKAVGAGGIMIEGSINGNVSFHNVQSQNYIENQVINPSQPDPEIVKHKKALENYLNRLSRACLSLPLAAVGGEESTENDVTLDKVYIDLNTTEVHEILDEPLGRDIKSKIQEIARHPEKERPVTVLESAMNHKRLALLGDPGAGKSTFVKILLAWQANACLGKPAPYTGFAASLIPVMVILRDLAPRLVGLEIEHIPAQARDDLLAKIAWEYIQADLGDDCADFRIGLHDALKSGQCLLVLDGLDEVPQDLRGRVRQTVDALLKRYDLQRIIVTCRVRSYVGEAVLPQFTSSTLAPFTVEQIGTFVKGWYNIQHDLGRINEAQAKERTADLTNAASQSDLRELSSNPMLLTTMAIIHQREVGLPRERVRLYQLAVEVLLRRWQKHKAGDTVGDTALAEFLKNDLKLRTVMENLAYAAHRASAESGGTGTLLRKDAIDLLEDPKNLGDLQLAGKFLDYVDQRAGLLVGFGGELSKPTSYSFPHRTFQEYLAGAYLVSQRDRVRTFYNLAAEGDSWNLAAQLAFEELFYNRRGENELLDMAYQLGASFKYGEQNERAFLWAGQISALVKREVLERDTLPSGGQAYIEKLLSGLVKMLSGNLASVERAETGRVLGKLGDPRLELTTLDAMQFCHIPAGKFIMGSKKGTGDKDETPQQELELPAFWMGRYTITNAQFAVFVQENGYQNPAYWSEAESNQIWRKGKIHLEWAEEIRQAPADLGEKFNLPNHPVVGITWYEMVAFTRWLTETWQTKGHLPADWQVTLPSEPEWEKAARGGLNIPEQALINSAAKLGKTQTWQIDGKSLKMIQNPMPKRAYPWGDDFDRNFSNISETGVGSTNTPGCFPKNISPYGVAEMSGNVWEWLSSKFDKYPYPATSKDRAMVEDPTSDSNTTRVVRGGAFNNNQDDSRCAFRFRSGPINRYFDLGFRVMLSPIFLS